MVSMDYDSKSNASRGYGRPGWDAVFRQGLWEV